VRSAARLALGGALGVALAAAALASVSAVDAQPAAPGAPAPGGSAPRDAVRSTCVEHLATGATRPAMKDELPKTGLSGYAVDLVVTLEHGKGETVLPGGFRLQRGSDAGASPRISSEDTSSGVRTTVHIPLLLLPDTPGRHLLRLPPLPIAVARAGGDLTTLCTSPHDILVEDPTANESKPRPLPNPPPRPQREPWEELKVAVMAIAIGLVLGTIFTWMLRRWAKRPKQTVAPAAVLPWIAALQELDRIRRSGQLAEGRTEEVFDLVSDCVRKYLGARYGFDGLETTTHEMKSLLRRVRPPVPELDAIGAFLDDSDLVKFARFLPAAEEAVTLLARAESIVRWTTPPQAKPTSEEGATSRRKGKSRGKARKSKDEGPPPGPPPAGPEARP
jgi:hypothetical protein